eukprot:TRINITY_DN6323_c0_g1_i2.p1 TRINITY_DN6323_c0_g1~~TRINITY_DN6323_c0_g1_i2.p1  ORF type:complete len:159 (-),score=27.39 TRINITY_DN6323_c0_g1_i2:271-747(-)
MNSFSEWEQRVAKDDRYVVLQYTNETEEVFSLNSLGEVENGKYDNPVPKGKTMTKKDGLHMKPGDTLKFGLKFTSPKKKMKIQHFWSFTDGSFTFSLTVSKVGYFFSALPTFLFFFFFHHPFHRKVFKFQDKPSRGWILISFPLVKKRIGRASLLSFS